MLPSSENAGNSLKQRRLVRLAGLEPATFLLRSSNLTPHVIEPQCGLAPSGNELAASRARIEHDSEHNFGAHLATEFTYETSLFNTFSDSRCWDLHVVPMHPLKQTAWIAVPTATQTCDRAPYGKRWRPLRDSNPCCRRDRATLLRKFTDLKEAGRPLSP